MSLMNKDPRKSIAALIIKAREKRNGEIVEERTPPAEELDGSIGLESAAEDIIKALDSKDPKMLVVGMRAMSEMIGMEDRSDEAPSAPSESESESQ